MAAYDYIVIGTGLAGATIAERLASDPNKNILIIDKRSTIAGNMYDYDDNGILVHSYGPHIFHTNEKEVFDYLSNFTKWRPYEHRVLGMVDGHIVPIPFNITSIKECFPKSKADHLIEVLIDSFGMDKKVPILKLREHEDPEIRELAEYIYQHVFLYYTMKQWGQTPDEIDPAVTARVPVYISTDDRYFQDTYQYMPIGGYTKLVERMLNKSNIDVLLDTDAKYVIKIVDGTIYFEDKPFTGKLIYTGAIDELFGCCFGSLPYRSLNFDFKNLSGTFQKAATVNYPENDVTFTRITEFKHFTSDTNPEDTVIVYEYPLAYDKNNPKANEPYYPINNEDNNYLYDKYVALASKTKNLYLLGRLAQYRYLNMDLVVKEALKLYERLKKEN